jgi:hypothetical protein
VPAEGAPVVLGGAVVVVVLVVVDVGVVASGVVVVGAGGMTGTGADAPAVACPPGGGLVCDGTGPATATTASGVGRWADGGVRRGTGTPAVWTLPKPARSDHQIELTLTTSPVSGALIISPSPI